MHNQPRTTISIPAAVLLGVAVTSAVTLAVIITMQSIVTIRVYEGTTALLASLVALTGTGVIICQAADRVMRRLEQLEERVSAQRVVYMPDPGRPVVDPEEFRAQVEQLVIEELGSREAVHSQGYAEGYVDGIARKGGEEPSPN